jgi:hypothetical protein
VLGAGFTGQKVPRNSAPYFSIVFSFVLFIIPGYVTSQAETMARYAQADIARILSILGEIRISNRFDLDVFANAYGTDSQDLRDSLFGLSGLDVVGEYTFSGSRPLVIGKPTGGLLGMPPAHHASELFEDINCQWT